MRSHNSYVEQTNNASSVFFGKLDSTTKLRLLLSYCYSLYGSVFWNVCNGYAQQVCRAWRVGILVCGAYHIILLPFSCRLPLYDELMKRLLLFCSEMSLE